MPYHPNHERAVEIYNLVNKRAPLKQKIKILKGERDRLLSGRKYNKAEQLERKIKKAEDDLKSLQRSIKKHKESSGLNHKDIARILSVSQSPRKLISRSDLEKKRQERLDKIKW